MKVNMYTIYDQKAKIYNKPFYVINEQVALRMARDLLNDLTTDVAKHPEDFLMVKLGTYDDEHATFDILDMHDVMFRFTDIPQEPAPEDQSFDDYQLTEAGAQHQ